jgi:hypothetical protein
MSRCCCHQRVRPLAYATPEFARELKIPNMEKPGQFLWPPPTPLVSPEMLAAIRTDPFIVSEAAKGTYIKERDRRIMEHNRRQIAEAEQRQREFEERQRKELESAKERDRQALCRARVAERITRWADVRCARESGVFSQRCGNVRPQA